jgi:hypothetical protein
MWRGWKVLAVVGVAALLTPTSPGDARAAGMTAWKGAETLTPVALAPNLRRCGAPPNMEGRFLGNGIDTAGGAYVVSASGCLNLQSLRVFDLEATDTYVGTGDQVLIDPADFDLVLDRKTCVAANAEPVAFGVKGGSGSFAGASGGGSFDFVMNHPVCNGLVLPVHISFHGSLNAP